MRKLLCLLLAIGTIMLCAGCGEREDHPLIDSSRITSAPSTAVATTVGSDNENEAAEDIYKYFAANDVEPEYSAGEIEGLKKTIHKSGDYMVSKYGPGICIHQYLGSERDIVIPEKLDNQYVVKIGDYYTKTNNGYITRPAFAEADFDSITLPINLKWVNYDFLGFRSVDLANGDFKSTKKILVDERNPNYCSVDGILYTKNLKTLLCVPSSYENSVLKVPDGTTRVMKYAIYCKNIKEIILPKTVTVVGRSSLIYSRELTDYSVDVLNPNYSTRSGVLFDKNKTKLYSYPMAKADTEYTLPDTVRYLTASFAFSQNLKTLITGKNLTNKITATVRIGYADNADKTMSESSISLIRGFDGSPAQAFAKEVGIDFEIV